MGKSYTSKYALELDGSTSMCWWVGRPPHSPPHIKGHGKPTEANLIKYVEAYIESLKIGGSNQHISKSLGYIPFPKWARIVHNDGSRQVVVEWKAPAFMLV